MALRGAAARRYAQAVFDIAKDTNSLDKWLSDLKALDAAFGTHAAVTALEDPKLKEADQDRILSERLPAGIIGDLAQNLLYLLVRRRRLALVPRILEAFQGMYNLDKGVIVADVTSAVPLDAAHQKRVMDQLSKITGKTVELHVHQDPGILGGLITRIGDELIDTSVAGKLAALSERLA